MILLKDLGWILINVNSDVKATAAYLTTAPNSTERFYVNILFSDGKEISSPLAIHSYEEAKKQLEEIKGKLV